MTMTLPSSPTGYDQVAPDAPPMFSNEQPMGMFAKGGRVGTKPVCIRVPREHTERMAKGGLAGEAKKVANAGVHGDTMIIHINRQEYDELLKHWGEPTINPETGMPQFTPFYKQKWFAPVVALASAALMATGVGAPLGATLLGTLGLEGLAASSVLGATGASIAGNAIIGAGAGALTGGGKGALIGGLTGGLGTIGSAALGATGNAVAGTGEGGFSGWYDSLGAGASGIRPPNSMDAYVEGTKEAVGKFGPVIPEGAFTTGGAPAASAGSGVLSSLAKPSFLIPAAILGASALGGMSKKDDPAAATTAQNAAPSDLNLNRRLEAVPLNRQRLAMPSMAPADYYTYGQRPEAVYYGPNALSATVPSPVEQESPTIKAAMGGPLSRYVGGPGTGRSDSIDAKLSDGEYVIDAETVALLGDGSSKAGAKRLDQFRANIRKQKGRELAKGKFSPDAKRPEQYLGAS
jgi:hypothetical protein